MKSTIEKETCNIEQTTAEMEKIRSLEKEISEIKIELQNYKTQESQWREIQAMKVVFSCFFFVFWFVCLVWF